MKFTMSSQFYEKGFIMGQPTLIQKWNDIIWECSLKDILDNLALVNNFSIHRHQPFQMNHLHVYKMVQIALSWQKVLH